MRGSRFGWVLVFSSFITLLLVSGVWTSFSVFIKPVQEEFAASRAEASLVASIGLVVSGVSLLFFGRMIDKYGPRKIILYSSLFMGASLCLMYLVTAFSHYVIIYGVFVSLGFAGAGLVAVTALIRGWFGEKSELELSIAQSGLPFGTLILTPVATWLLVSFGWRSAYLSLGLILLIIVPGIFILIRIREPPNVASVENSEKRESRSLTEVVNSFPFILMIPVHFICGWTDIAIVNHIAPYVIDSGFTEMFAAYTLSVIGGATWLGTLVFGFLSRRLMKQHLIIFIYVIRAATFFFLFIEPKPIFLLLFSIFFGLTQFSMVPLISSWIGDNYRHEFLGTLFAITNIVHSVGAAMGTYLNGWVFDASGSYFFAFLISAVLSLIASVLYIFIKD